jgi:hypothetical protein
MANNYDRLTCEIQVKKQTGDLIRFYSCVSIEIESSFDTLTDTATVSLPYDNRWIKKDANGFNRIQMISGNEAGFFTVGDEIRIYFGYNFTNNLEFEGFIAGIEPKTPLKLLCQDKSWKLKKGRLLFSTEGKTTLKEVAPKLLANTGIELHPLSLTQEIEFGKMVVRNISPAALLDEWRDIGLLAYMREGKLVVGRSFFSSGAGNYDTTKMSGYKPETYNTQKDIISDNLVLNTISADEIAVKAVSAIGNKTLSVTVVKDPSNPSNLLVVEEKDGRLKKEVNESNQKKLTAQMEAKGIYIENYTLKTQHEFNLERAQLIEAAKAAFPRHIKTGLDGTFTTFGDYSLRPATSIYLLDPHNPDKNGEYLIKSVTKTFGSDGIRQVVSIPYKIKNIDNTNLLA